MRLSFGGVVIAGGALVLAACSGGGSSQTPVVTATAAPVLVAGSVAHYSGTDSTTHVFTNPTTAQPNFTAGYSFTTVRSVQNAAAGAPAAFDIDAVTTYTLTQDPGQGVVRGTDTVDTFENQVASGSGTSVQSVGSKSVAVGVDESAGSAGGGPFTQTATTTTTFASPETVGVYPLVAGGPVAEPVGRTAVTATTDANGGTVDTATTFATSSTRTTAADGSYTQTQQLSNGETQTITESPNGTGTIAESGPVFTLNDTIGMPANTGTGYGIPVTTFRQNATTGATPAPTATTMPFTAADWYPGGALPSSPLETSTQTVRGPVALPAACAAAPSEPNLVEVDTTTTTLDIDASIATNAQQRFDSNGTNVCVLRTVTTTSYALTTGLPVQTATETYAQVLTSLTTSSAARTPGNT